MTDPEKFLLKKIILDKPERPSNYRFSELYRFYDYEKFSENEVKEIVQSLVERGLLQEDNSYFSLTRDTFLKLKQRYRFSILLRSDYYKMTFPLLAGLMAGIVTLVPSISKMFSGNNKNDLNRSELEAKIDSLQNRVLAADTINYSKTPIDSSGFSKDVTILKNNYSQLAANVNSLNDLLQDNPTRFIEIATLKRDIEDLKKDVSNNNESLKRDIDRISSYNNTLIVFMITFLVAYIGIGVFNFINKSKNAEL